LGKGGGGGEDEEDEEDEEEEEELEEELEKELGRVAWAVALAPIKEEEEEVERSAVLSSSGKASLRVTSHPLVLPLFACDFLRLKGLMPFGSCVRGKIRWDDRCLDAW
tara:strand:- start:160 stop:483 length:324 start_codon:yes stop_codon:yes gene_type:complete